MKSLEPAAAQPAAVPAASGKRRRTFSSPLSWTTVALAALTWAYAMLCALHTLSN